MTAASSASESIRPTYASVAIHRGFRTSCKRLSAVDSHLPRKRRDAKQSEHSSNVINGPIPVHHNGLVATLRVNPPVGCGPDATYSDSLITRPAVRCTGRAFIGYRREKMSICCVETCTGCFITIHSTPSLHGGVVSEPM